MRTTSLKWRGEDILLSKPVCVSCLFEYVFLGFFSAYNLVHTSSATAFWPQTLPWISFWSLLSFVFICRPIYILIIPCGKCWPTYLGKTTAAARAALPSPTRACWGRSCCRNPPPNSDMDYRIFNVRTRSFLCVRIQHLERLSNGSLYFKQLT